MSAASQEAPRGPLTAVPFFPGVDPRLVPLWALQALDRHMEATEARWQRRATLIGIAPPKHVPAFVSVAGHRVWEFDEGWFLVELEPGIDLCVSVLHRDDVVRCYCPDGVQLIGCPHVLIVGERDVSLPSRAKREQQVAELGALNWTDQQIADYLGISRVTVRTVRLRTRRRRDGPGRRRGGRAA